MHDNSPPRQGRTVFIETLGCQMNVNDSEVMLGLLKKEGFDPTSDPNQADLLIINTCQIRGSAEDKAFSHLGRWRKLKAKHPQRKIAMAGCVSQQRKEEIFRRAPYVDIVFGTQNIHELPGLVRRAYAGERSVLAVDRQKQRSAYDYMTDVDPVRESDLSAWITVIEGCNYFCTYCVVPYTRGRQISRAPESILREATNLAARGFKEITLLGQTVDSYGKDWTDRRYDLADLMTDLSEIDGLARIRFMTSHPLDLSDRIIDAVAALPKVMEYVHIPMQAGDDTVLARMRRGYTAAQYYDLVARIYDRIPGVAVTGDYIVGFPGETDAQFRKTVDSVRIADLHAANTAAYSPRAQTPAAVWEDRGDAVPDAVKRERLRILNEAVSEQSLRKNRDYDGRTVEVLVEGRSRRNAHRLTGRTRSNKVVNFDAPHGEDVLAGRLIPVRITEPQAFSLTGVMVDETGDLSGVAGAGQ